ncbi:conserved hypothetical protein [Frankia sp. Hr75.2]|nr:conserved hypothetical protein [Frankia sp. Hr75.2]
MGMGKRSVFDGDFEHLRGKAGAFRDVVDGVALLYQVTSLFEGPAPTGVDPADDHLTRLMMFLRPAQSRAACQRSTSEVMAGISVTNQG